ncbi:MAG: hypothetical protein P8N02_17920 [Actinomycetota bacterium]|nr:hypothetical protein [Actinomycetota bacterium]
MTDTAADPRADELVVLDPRPPAPDELMAPAPRLATLDGARIALVHNGKTHGRELMELVIEELSTRYHLGEVLHIGPPSPGYGGDPADAAPAAEQVMAAISAVGD